MLNDHKVNNVVLYTVSNIFPVLINNADYYFNPGYYLDFYALWANYELNKPIIVMKYGEFSHLEISKEIEYQLNGNVVLCNSEERHIKCPKHKCLFYGYKGVQNVPEINWDRFHSVVNSLIFDKNILN